MIRIKHTVVWENLEMAGLEYLELDFGDEQIDVNSTIISMIEDSPYKISYNLSLDRNWKVREVRLVTTHSTKSLYISTDGNGIWYDESGNELHSLNGAIDIDISGTPFTNSIPINRLKCEENLDYSIEVVYISVPDLTLKKLKQNYRFLSQNLDRKVFYYRSGNFESKIEVDRLGLVTNYPGLFKRIK